MGTGALIRRGGLRVARIALPLLAIVLLSTMFLVSRGPRPGRAPPPPGAVGDIAEEGMTAPRYAGVTTEGTAIVIGAARMRADGEGGSAEGLSARLDLPDGRRLSVEAGQGHIDMTARVADLSGGVRLSSDGLSLSAPRARMGLERMRLTAEGGVSARSPRGRITADVMEIRPDPSETGHYIVIFKDGVRLLYDADQGETRP